MTKPANPATKIDPQEVENQALALFNAGKYKDALALYKHLLSIADNTIWRRQLACCYLRRAEGFALKGLYKEAVVLWENYRQQAQPPHEQLDHYIAWLIQSKNPAGMLSALKQLTAGQLDKDYPELAAVLGGLILTRHPEFQQVLPHDSVFIAHLKIVQTALQAHGLQDLTQLDQALRQLPYRSAFRDLRTLLKSSPLLPTEPAQAYALLDKMPANSVYARAARLLSAGRLSGSELVRELSHFSPAQRRFVYESLPLQKPQIELIESLCKQKQPWPDKLKFNLIIQFQSLFGRDAARRFCSALLNQYPAGQRDFDKAFGACDEFEQNRLKALEFEDADKSYDAEYYWKQCIKTLTKQAGNDLKIAMIYRHIAQNQPDQTLKTQYLCASLQHDPDDKSSYLQILHYYHQHPEDAENYKDWLNKALTQFPQDVDVLLRAAQAAMAGKAYKKAIQYAEKILKIDPVNSYAKQLLFTNHLNHARHLLANQKYPLAEREIQQAEALKLGKHYALQLELMRGLLSFASGDKQQGLSVIAQALNTLNPDAAAAHFQAGMEALLAGLPVAPILRVLAPMDTELVSAQALTRLIQLIEQYRQNDAARPLLHKALDKIKPQLKKSLLQQNYSETLQLSFCQALDGIQHFELMRPCAKSGQNQWQKPLWLYYKIYAETNGDPGKCSFMQRASLQLNLNDAYRDKDFRAQTLIGRYLDAYHAVQFPQDSDSSDDFSPDGETENFADPIFALFGHLPDDLFDKIDLKADLLARKTPPARLMLELSRMAGAKPDKLVASMQNDLDLFSALLLLKAANDLNLDIEVTARDILDYFGLNPF